MWTRMAALLGLAVAVGALPAACNIENCEEGAYCDDDDDDDARGSACHEACGRLATCGRIDASDRRACMEACLDSIWYEEETQDYCECIEHTSCTDLARSCGRPPFATPTEEPEPEPADDAGVADPDPTVTPDASQEPDSGSVEPEPAACECDQDCASGESCLDGVCRAQCEVSCDCNRDQICQEGLCMPAESSCESGCEATQDACGAPACAAPV
jgi:hypothetical protein